MTNSAENIQAKNFAALAVIALLIVLAYSNSFNADWHMDDYPNILHNPAIQISDLSLTSLQRAVGISTHQGNNLPRPVVNIAFALNWYSHGTQVAGYHLVNMVVHVLNAWLLFLTVTRLSTLPVIPDPVRRHRVGLALVTALLWALNPIQTQAVTYVVQRYTAMATLFYLAALYGYIRGRMAVGRERVGPWVGLTLACYLLALGAKENAAVWPLSALLVEFIFFRDKDGALSPHFFKIFVTAGIVSVVFVGGLLLTFDIDIVRALTRSFDGRPFTLTERLLTQPRVLLFHISQIFYPIPQRLSLEHVFPPSVDLLTPVTTLPAILVVGGMIAGALFSVRHRPLLAFAILFFFLNHLVESSVLPLEMVFEHRNYLPSLFLFWPLAAGGLHLHSRLAGRSALSAKLLPFLAAGVLLIMAAGTFTRNMDWQNARRLWTDTYRKAPQSARAATNLANELARAGAYENAEALYRKALTLYSPKKNQFKVVARSNLATMYANTGKLAEAAAQWERVLAMVPVNRPARFNLANIYMALGRLEEAEKQIDWLLKRHPEVVRFLNLKALLLIKKRQPEDALARSRQSLQVKPNQRDALLNAGVALSMIEEFVSADWFLQRATSVAARDLEVYLSRLEHLLAKGEGGKAQTLARGIVLSFSLDTIWAELHDQNNTLQDPDSLEAVITRAIDRLAAGLETAAAAPPSNVF